MVKHNKAKKHRARSKIEVLLNSREMRYLEKEIENTKDMINELESKLEQLEGEHQKRIEDLQSNCPHAFVLQKQSTVDKDYGGCYETTWMGCKHCDKLKEGTMVHTTLRAPSR